MGFVSRVFGSDTVVETAAKGAYNGLDKIWFTKEERSEAEQKELEVRKDFALKLLELTKGASPARRMIAFIVMSLWWIVGIDVIILINLNIILGMNYDLNDLTNFAVDFVVTPTGFVLTFYFLKNIMPSAQTAQKEK